MNEFRVTDASGRVVNRDDVIVDFRGDEWLFVMVTRGTEYNGTAKVLVSDHGGQMEYYARVFDLNVETLTDFVCRPCPMCGKASTLKLPVKRIQAWVDGELIQNAFPYLTADERELMITGIDADCYARIAAYGDSDA
jgi:hypothetical protein